MTIKMILKILPTVIVFIVLLIAFQKGKEYNENQRIAETAKKQEVIREIRNHPTDLNDVINVLRSGQF